MICIRQAYLPISCHGTTYRVLAQRVLGKTHSGICTWSESMRTPIPPYAHFSSPSAVERLPSISEPKWYPTPCRTCQIRCVRTLDIYAASVSHGSSNTERHIVCLHREYCDRLAQRYVHGPNQCGHHFPQVRTFLVHRPWKGCRGYPNRKSTLSLAEIASSAM